MTRRWTDAEYRQTHAIYEAALRDSAGGRAVDRAEVLRRAGAATDRPAQGSVRMHFGNMTAARRDLGLPTLAAFPPLPNYPPKLAAFLAARHRFAGSRG